MFFFFTSWPCIKWCVSFTTDTCTHIHWAACNYSYSVTIKIMNVSAVWKYIQYKWHLLESLTVWLFSVHSHTRKKRKSDRKENKCMKNKGWRHGSWPDCGERVWSQDPLSGAALSSSGGSYARLSQCEQSLARRMLGRQGDKEKVGIFFCLICQIYCNFYQTEVHSAMFRCPSPEAHFSCSSSNPFWNIAISAILCFREIYTCFPCPCASCFTTPGIPRTTSHLFLISVSIFCTAAAVRGSVAKQNFSFMTVRSWSPFISEPYRAVRYMGQRSKPPYGSMHRMIPGML